MSDNTEALSRPDYWDEHYSKSDGETPTHEWFRSFADLEEFFQKYLFTAPRYAPANNPIILHLGSGDSAIPAEFDPQGYRRQICVDFSPKIVGMMAERHKDKSSIEWRHMDVRNMSGIASKSVDIAFDKGTLDAMIYGSPWSPPTDVWENSGKYLGEPHFMKPLLSKPGLWELELDILGAKSGGFEYYGWVIRKAAGQEQKA